MQAAGPRTDMRRYKPLPLLEKKRPSYISTHNGAVLSTVMALGLFLGVVASKKNRRSLAALTSKKKRADGATKAQKVAAVTLTAAAVLSTLLAVFLWKKAPHVALNRRQQVSEKTQKYPSEIEAEIDAERQYLERRISQPHHHPGTGI